MIDTSHIDADMSFCLASQISQTSPGGSVSNILGWGQIKVTWLLQMMSGFTLALLGIPAYLAQSPWRGQLFPASCAAIRAANYSSRVGLSLYEHTVTNQLAMQDCNVVCRL